MFFLKFHFYINFGIMLNSQLVRIPRSGMNATMHPIRLKNDVKLPKLSKLLSKTPKMDINLTNITELPLITRFQTPGPKKTSPKAPNLMQNFSFSPERQQLNLEKIILQEEKLFIIIDSFLQAKDLYKTLSEYWDLSNNSSL